VGRTAPFPYWPDADREHAGPGWKMSCRQSTNPGGFQLRVKRKRRHLFDARLYVSPLIDAVGKANRVDDLDDRHHRAQPGARAVVRPRTNASPRCWRHSTPRSRSRRWATMSCSLPTSCTDSGLARTRPGMCNWWHRPACPSSRPTVMSPGQRGFICRPAHRHADERPSRKVLKSLSPELGKWLEVRSRYLNWVDGRLAQMVIATDITPRRLPKSRAPHRPNGRSRPAV
jgi:hypothetical protein